MSVSSSAVSETSNQGRGAEDSVVSIDTAAIARSDVTVRAEIFVGKLQKAALMLARILAVAIVVMIIVWATGKNKDNGFMGGLDFKKNLLNYHPVLMSTGLILFSGWSITAYRLPFCSFWMNRTLHVTLHFFAKVCMTAGLLAVSTSKDYPQFNNSPTGYMPHLFTLHSWIGVITSIFLFQNDILGFLIYILPFASRKIMTIYRPEHIFFGKFAFISVCMAVLTGMMRLNDILDCKYTVSSQQSNSAKDYLQIPTGCRISNGAAVLVVLLLLCILFGLETRSKTTRHSHWLRKSFELKRMKRSEKRRNRGTGSSALARSTADERIDDDEGEEGNEEQGEREGEEEEGDSHSEEDVEAQDGFTSNPLAASRDEAKLS